MRFNSILLLVAVVVSACGGTPGLGSGGDAGTSFFPPDAGLPCEVANLVVNHCLTCHGQEPSGNATFSLVQRSDFTAPSAIDPTATIGQRAVIRMQASVAPMPPVGNPAPTSAEISAFAAWVTAQMPAGACASPTLQTSCTSGTRWTRGTDGSRSMLPGYACIACHAQPSGGETGPIYSFAGTVYSGFHEENACNGSFPSGTVIEILDRTGALALTMTPNSAGNFFSSANVSLPYTARVKANGQVRTMTTAQTVGDCNSCHTELGANGAPGRIAVP